MFKETDQFIFIMRSSYSLHDASGVPLDWKLDELFNQKQNGFFIELGGNDGITQSNTALLAKERGWKGVLIEPSHSGYVSCTINRPESYCFHAACVSPNYTNEWIEGDFTGHLMSSVNGKRLNSQNRVRVQARTLESILDDCGSISTIDFLSLDTEGYELPILQGLNLKRYRPHYMLIEIYSWDYEKIVDFLKSHDYECLSNFSNYNHTQHPGWDGTHNDYLFKDKRV
jgi:FkbM family methyltransferase